MELKEGMYVRTELGIDKIKDIVLNGNFYEDSGLYLEKTGKILCGKQAMKELKASNNIIDLIEEDDLIKCQFGEQTLILQVGARYTTSHQVNDWVKGVFTPDNDFWSLKYLDEEDILQSIVTKEQFESMEYKVN